MKFLYLYFFLFINQINAIEFFQKINIDSYSALVDMQKAWKNGQINQTMKKNILEIIENIDPSIYCRIWLYSSSYRENLEEFTVQLENFKKELFGKDFDIK